jgi:uncharacterized protein YycO
MWFISILGLMACGFSIAQPSPTVDSTNVKSGDIIFQVSSSSQAPAVALASGSPITHVGLIAVEGDRVTVIEAVEPVREIPIEKFIDHGSMWGVSRLVDEPKNPGWAAKVVKAARAMKGRHYDALFQWGDDRIYCSELVWKAYQRGAGIELVSPERLGDMNLSLPPVRALIQRRTGGKGLNLEEKVVTPGHLHDSEMLETVVGFL